MFFILSMCIPAQCTSPAKLLRATAKRCAGVAATLDDSTDLARGVVAVAVLACTRTNVPHE